MQLLVKYWYSTSVHDTELYQYLNLFMFCLQACIYDNSRARFDKIEIYKIAIRTSTVMLQLKLRLRSGGVLLVSRQPGQAAKNICTIAHTI